ncbi:MAG: hypothetical protein ABR977_11900 [Candidatus Dormibacteria bacterium]|jgi:hypothetical protein
MVGVLLFFYVYALAGETLASAPGVPWPAYLPYVVVCIAGAGYGLAVIATARRPRVRLMLREWGLGASPVARMWFGLAYVLPLAVSLGARLVLGRPGALPTGTATALPWLAPLLGAAAFAICLITANLCSLRPVKRAILDGRAPSFRISEDASSWWDGEAWASIFVSAPESALRSPDGNHWWAGRGWLPLPPPS